MPTTPKDIATAVAIGLTLLSAALWLRASLVNRQPKRDGSISMLGMQETISAQGRWNAVAAGASAAAGIAQAVALRFH